MRGILRLIEGILNGDSEVIPVVIFAVVGTAVIYGITEYKRKRRKS
jgi:hypothetical protein